MSVKQLLNDKPYAKIASEVVQEQELKKLNDKLDLTIKIIENMAMRIDNLEFELYRGK